MVDHTGTDIHNGSKVVAKYLRPLTRNECSITDTLSFQDLFEKTVVMMNLMEIFLTALKACLQVFLPKKRWTIFYRKFMLIKKLNLCKNQDSKSCFFKFSFMN